MAHGRPSAPPFGSGSLFECGNECGKEAEEMMAMAAREERGLRQSSDDGKAVA